MSRVKYGPAPTPRWFCAVTAERQAMEIMQMSSERVTPSGLTHGEAQELHRYFVKSAILMSLFPFLAHVSLWLYKPWLAF